MYIIEECKSILDKVKARSFEHAEFPVVDYPASSAVTKRLLQALHIYEKKLGKNIFTIDVIVQNTRILAIGIDTDHLYVHILNLYTLEQLLCCMSSGDKTALTYYKFLPILSRHGTKRSDPSKCDTSKAWFLQPHLYIRAPININELRSHFDSMKIYLNKIKLSVEKTMYSVAKVATLSKYYDSKSAIAPKLHWDHDKEPKQYPGAEMDKVCIGVSIFAYFLYKALLCFAPVLFSCFLTSDCTIPSSQSLLGLAEKIVEADKELRKEFTKLDSVNSELQGIAFGTNGQIDYVNYWTLAPAKAFLRK